MGKPRSLDQHKRFFGLVRAAFHHWPEVHDQQFADETECRKFLIMKAGWRDLRLSLPLSGIRAPAAIALVTAALRSAGSHAAVRVDKGTLYVWTPKSINFAAMPHLEFCALSDAVSQTIELETGLSSEELLSGMGKVT
jgi:hypothetical protein